MTRRLDVAMLARLLVRRRFRCMFLDENSSNVLSMLVVPAKFTFAPVP